MVKNPAHRLVAGVLGEIGEARIDAAIYNNTVLAKLMGSQNILLESVELTRGVRLEGTLQMLEWTRRC